MLLNRDRITPLVNVKKLIKAAVKKYFISINFCGATIN